MSLDARARIVISAVAAEAIREFQKTGAAIKGVSDQAKQQSDTLGKTSRDWKSYLTAIGAVTAALYTAKKAFDFARQGAEIQELRGAFDDLATQAGQSSNAIVSAIQHGADGTINSMDAISTATRVMNLGIASTPEEFEKLANVAETLGDRLGLDTAAAIDTVSSALTSLMPRALRSAGITADAEGVWKKYAASMGTTAEKLTDAQKRTALLNDANERLGAGTSSLADSFDQLDVAFDEQMMRLRETAAVMADPYVTGLVRLSNALTGATGDAEKLPGVLEQTTKIAQRGGPVMYAFSELFLGLSTAAADLITHLKDVPNALRGILKIYPGAVAESEAFAKSTREVGQALFEGRDHMVRSSMTAEDYARIMQEITAENQDYVTSLMTISSTTAQYEEQQGTLNEKIQETKDKIKDLLDRGYSPMSDKIKGLQGDLADLEGSYASNAEAFTARTNAIIFDMAREQLAADILTGEEVKQLLEFGTQLGVIDQTAARTYQNWAAYIDAYLKNPAVGSFQNWMDKYATSRNVTLSYSMGGFTGIDFDPFGGTSSEATTSAAQQPGNTAMGGFTGIDFDIDKQSGGPLTGVNLVGEVGPELVINGVVIPTRLTKQLMNLGLRPTAAMLAGGSIDSFQKPPLWDRTAGNNESRITNVSNDNRQTMPNMVVQINNQLDLKSFEALWRQMLGG